MLPRIAPHQANTFTGAVFVIGLGLLVMFNHLWPGILLVLGLTLLIQGLVLGRAWYASQAALWLIGLGVLFEVGANGGTFVGLLLVIGGSSVLMSIYQPPPFLRGKKPATDRTWD